MTFNNKIAGVGNLMIVSVTVMIVVKVKVAAEVEVEIVKKLENQENLILNHRISVEGVLEITIVIVILDHQTQVH